VKEGSAHVNTAKQLHELLKRELESKKYVKGDKLPSVRELSVTYNVNKSTVVNVLATLANEGLIVTESGKGSFVMDVKETQKQIAILFFDTASPFRVETEILAQIQRNIPDGYFLSLHDTAQNYKVFERKIENLIDNGVKGIIAIPPKFYTPKPSDAEHLNRLLGDSVPLVFIIRKVEGVHADFFSMDLDKGIQKAITYLSSIDKKKICIIKHDSQKFVEEELRGLETACHKHNIEVNPDFILDYDDNIETINSKLMAVLPHVDAVIGPDHTLCSLQGVIQSSRKSIPAELSIVGINDVVSHYFSPPLTSVRFPVEKIGVNAIHTIIDRLERGGGTEKIEKNFVPDLIIRET